jgi:MFS family permease
VRPTCRADPDTADPIEARRQHRRVMVSSCLGSIIEYDDFLLYASASALVFGAVLLQPESAGGHVGQPRDLRGRLRGPTPRLLVALVVGLGICQAAMQGPLSAMYAELFPTKIRYTGSSVVYQLASLGAGLAPLVFASILTVTGTAQTVGISALVAVSLLVSVACALTLPETSHTDLADVPDRREGVAADRPQGRRAGSSGPGIV